MKGERGRPGRWGRTVSGSVVRQRRMCPGRFDTAVNGILRGARLANRTKVKIGPANDAKLYKEFVAGREENGTVATILRRRTSRLHSHRSLAASVRPEVMDAFRRYNEKSRSYTGSWRK